MTITQEKPAQQHSIKADRHRASASALEKVLPYLDEHAERGNPQSVVEALQRFSHEVGGLMYVGKDKGDVVEKVIAKHRPTTLVELGSYHGYSTVRFSHYAKLQNANARYFSFELDEKHADITRKVVDFAGLSSTVTVFTGVWKEQKHRLRDEFGVGKVDLFFIDHEKSAYLPDAQDIEQSGYLQNGSVLVADNVLVPGAPDYRKWLADHPKFSTSITEVTIIRPGGQGKDGVEVSVYHAA
ncbi:hypothetical protein RI367_001072 [Sorochytrium milnesiophthora]